MKKCAQILALLALISTACFSSAEAQTSKVPAYAKVSNEETLHGRIRAISGQYDLQMSDDRGYVDNLRMHQGTIINPIGLTLAVGMQVTVLGHTRGNVFEVNEIDTPYTLNYAVPVPVYAPYYPYYGYYGSYYPYWGWGHFRRTF